LRALLLACLALAAAAPPALGQDALRGKRLYHEVGRLAGAGVSCVGCHGGLPGALHGLGRAADDPARIDYAIGTVAQMALLRGRLSAQDMADIAAYVARPGVPSPDPRIATSGAAARPYAADRLEFSGADALAGTVRLSNLGTVALSLVAGPALTGEHAARFTIAETTCTPDLVLREGESCAVTILFGPEAGRSGLSIAVLRLAHDWIGAGANVALIGRPAP
jgi:mono/diheme cytochrome c family protein